MLTVALFAASAICAIGWLNRYVCCVALVLYMKQKNYTPPSDAEMRACSEETIRNLLKLR